MLIVHVFTPFSTPVLCCILDIDECVSNVTNNCEHVCTNMAGSYECSCETGYYLASDAINCRGKVKLLAVDQRSVNIVMKIFIHVQISMSVSNILEFVNKFVLMSLVHMDVNVVQDTH